MTELEKEAREYCDSVKQATGRESDPANAFQVGAEWQSKQFPWISVEARLPEYDGKLQDSKRYLIKVEYGSMEKKYSTTLGWLRSRNKWNLEMDWVTVSHWMEIPE